MGAPLTVRLRADHTTVYRWAPVLPDGAIVMAGEPRYEQEAGGVGTGGTETWTFRATRTGAHVRSGAHVAREVVFTLDVP